MRQQTSGTEPSQRLKIAKILQDYKDDTVDYIRTSEALESLIAADRKQAVTKAMIDELLGHTAFSGQNRGAVHMDKTTVDARLQALQDELRSLQTNPDKET